MLETRIADLLEAPDARLVIERVQAILADEAKRRRAFYEWAGDDMRAEFINGEIVLPPPTPLRNLEAEQNLALLLRIFVDQHKLGEVASARAMISLTRNDYEPDICFWRTEIANTFNNDTLYFPTPDFVVEAITNDTVSRDRGIKFEDYAAHGVLEYWIIDPVRKSVEQYQLDEATMAFASVATLYIDDALTALTVPGFQIPVRAIFEKETNMETLRKLLNKVD